MLYSQQTLPTKHSCLECFCVLPLRFNFGPGCVPAAPSTTELLERNSPLFSIRRLSFQIFQSKGSIKKKTTSYHFPCIFVCLNLSYPTSHDAFSFGRCSSGFVLGSGASHTRAMTWRGTPANDTVWNGEG